MKWRASRGLTVAGGVLLAVLVLVAIGEALAWPFLAQPVQNFLTRKLEREVRFAAEAAPAEGQANSPLYSPSKGPSNGKSSGPSNGQGQAPAAAPGPDNPAPAFGVRFFGGVRLQVGQLNIASAAWSQAPHFLQATAVQIDLRYIDLWRFYRGEPGLRIERLRAKSLDAQLERLADGRASWQFGPPTVAPLAGASPLPRFGRIELAHGRLVFRDQQIGAEVDATLSLVQGQTPQLEVLATGQYRQLPLRIELLASGELPLLVGEDVGSVVVDPPAGSASLPSAASAVSAASAAAPSASPLAVQLKASVGRAKLNFDGEAADVLGLQRLTGRFLLSGPSLAAVGDPLGVTLPTTAAFRSEGRLTRQGGRWQVEVDQATIGRSQLGGSFVYNTERPVPLLTGRLVGTRLELVDLGPAFGAAVEKTVPAKTAKLIPSRPFDLASLRKMDADVRVDVAELNLGTRLLEPLRPLRGHLTLAGGVLTLADLDARTADGSLRGEVGLDGRKAPALWHADVHWADVRLERWIRQEPPAGQTAAPPWVSGRLNGRAVLKGQGVSTADILASMEGSARTELQGGALSHLAVEAAGIDIAQALGVWLKGDDALPVNCGVADLAVAAGVVRPRVLVLDTGDSALWVSGTLSLASEQMDLRAVVAPKDFSPLSLRTPLHVGGTFSDPAIALEKGPLARKLGGAALLALINPFAALIPLIDNGSAEAGQKAAAGCQRLMQNTVGRRADGTAVSGSAPKGKALPTTVKPSPSQPKDSP